MKLVHSDQRKIETRYLLVQTRPPSCLLGQHSESWNGLNQTVRLGMICPG